MKKKGAFCFPLASPSEVDELSGKVPMRREMGSANSHANTNLPMLLAGGGFQHARHLAFDAKKNYPLPKLFVSILPQMGLEVNRFASSTGTMRGLPPG